MRRNLATRLRRWLAEAILPWSAASALRLWRRMLAETGSEAVALDRLTAAESRLVARDAARIWGEGHPMAGDTRRPVAG